MDVSHVGLRVRDLEASLKFYTALGFTAHERIVHSMPDGTLFEGVRMTRRIDG